MTAPLPAFRGSAAVPSTVDVFINNTRMYSQDVKPGPFLVSNLPSIAGAGSATIVVRDATGRESVETVSIYGTPQLLKSGLFDYSFEAGFVRQDYGVAANEYDDQLVGSGSLRFGLSDRVTIESHTEIGASLINAGVGASFNPFDSSLWSLALSVSNQSGNAGAQGYAAVQTVVGPATLRLSTQRTVGAFRDLAAIVQSSEAAGAFLPAGIFASNLEPPRALDVASVSLSLPDELGSLGLSIINREAEDQTTRIAAGSYSMPFVAGSTLIMTGFHDISNHGTGVFVGLSLALGDRGHGWIGLARDHGQPSVTAEYAKVASQEPGSVGWRVSGRAGHIPQSSATLTYQGSAARVEAGVDQVSDRMRGRVGLDGGLVITGEGVFLSNRVEDAFAIVEVGVANVDVLLDNRKVASTDASGRALVPGLRSFQRNKISIDPDLLPPDATVSAVDSLAVPADRSGVAVELKASRGNNAAIVVLRAPDGAFLPVGANGIVTATGRTFVVGYDGRGFIEDLGPTNLVTIETGDRVCSATFSFNGGTGYSQLIDGVTCR